MEGSRRLTTPVVVATVQSLSPEATQDLLAANTMPILTVLIDEAHHAVPGSAYERVQDAIEQAAGAEPVAIIGLTATPYRNDERSMLSLLPVCAFARTIPDMVQEGYLAPLTIPRRGPAREVIVNLREGPMSTHWYDTTSRGEKAAQFPSRSVLIRIEKQRSSS